MSGYDDFEPKWAMDGKMMIWGSTRDGARVQAGFSATMDVYAMFFTKESYDRFRLSKEDYTLLKEQEDKDKEKSKDSTKIVKALGKKEKKGEKPATRYSRKKERPPVRLGKSDGQKNAHHHAYFRPWRYGTFERWREVI
ncbi:MAG: hypothetical protein WDM78_00440 [Puia sp.]